jgi:hypothetical protein
MPKTVLSWLVASLGFLESPFNQPRILTTRDGQVVLRYLRVVEAGCDLYHKEKAACWEYVKKRLELKRTQAPVCSGYTPDSRESVIAYPVEGDLSSRQRTVKTISVLASRLTNVCGIGQCLNVVVIYSGGAARAKAHAPVRPSIIRGARS